MVSYEAGKDRVILDKRTKKHEKIMSMVVPALPSPARGRNYAEAPGCRYVFIRCDPALQGQGGYFLPENRYAPFGTWISNRAPSPSMPFS